jgi:hypothetical protein
VGAKVRLTRKFANMINGIDLSAVRAGDEIEVSSREADMLIAEGWAAPVERANDKPSRRPSTRRKPGR